MNAFDKTVAAHPQLQRQAGSPELIGMAATQQPGDMTLHRPGIGPGHGVGRWRDGVGVLRFAWQQCPRGCVNPAYFQIGGFKQRPQRGRWRQPAMHRRGDFIMDQIAGYQNRDPRLSATIIHDEYSLTDFSGNEVTIDTSPGAEPNGLNFSSNSTPTGYYVSKFYDQQARNVSNSGLNLIVIRYAEVLLNYAEAKIESGTFTSADWNNTVRQIRERAGLSGAAALNYPGNDQEALRTIVRNERRLELAFEAGHRFFDIRRWQIADEVLDGWAHGIQTNVSPQDDGYERVDLRTFDTDKHYLWPIPQSERDINDKLSQNPNW